MKRQIILKGLTIGMSILIAQSSCAFWIVGNMPTWQNVLYGVGDGTLQRMHEAKTNSLSYSRHSKAAGISSLVGVGTVLALGAAEPIIYKWAIIGPSAIQGPVKSSEIKSNINSINNRMRSLTKNLNLDLRSNDDGASFINLFGEIQSAEFNNMGMLQSFICNNMKFELYDHDNGSYFVAKQGDNESIHLYVEPNFIPKEVQ